MSKKGVKRMGHRTSKQPPRHVVRHTESKPILWPRQRQLLELLCQGYALKEAAGKMGITYRTAAEYLAIARGRCSSRTTVQLAAAYCRGLI